MGTPEQRLESAKSILNFEARRDARGHLAVYHLPIEDGGGTYEIAGINEKYHPDEAARLASLIGEGKHDQAESEAIEIIAKFTDVVSPWCDVFAIECYLRDCTFNRGPRGAARILQRAVEFEDDGDIGPLSKAAIANRKRNPNAFLTALRAAREDYERKVVHRDEGSIFWNGLVNRWNKALAFAQGFVVAPALALDRTQAGQPPETPAGAVCESCGPDADTFAKPIVHRWEPTSHQSSRNNRDIDRVVIHYTTSRNIEGSISWFKHGSPRTSAHYIVGQDGALVQMVNDSDRAWHAGNADMNARSIGIEHVAAAGDRITGAQAKTSAALIAWLMAEYNVDKDGVIPHCCVKDTSCCGDLFQDFGGGAGKSCDVQKGALHKWMTSVGIN